MWVIALISIAGLVLINFASVLQVIDFIVRVCILFKTMLAGGQIMIFFFITVSLNEENKCF